MRNVCKVIHSIPGRTRIKINQCPYNPNEIEARLRSIPGITSATYSQITQNALVYHSSSQLQSMSLAYLQSLFNRREEVALSSGLKDKEGFNEIKKQAKEVGFVLATLLLEKLLLSTSPTTMLKLITPSSIAVLIASRKTIRTGLSSIFNPNPETLTTAALIASLLKGSPQSALVIYFMSTISEILTEYTMNRTRGYVKEMMEIDTPFAWLMTEEGHEVKVPTNQVRIGDKIIAFQGEKIPFDGTVLSYSAQVDQSSITGEYQPAHVISGHYVYAGSIITEGKIVIEVDKIGEDLAVNRMIKLIEEAQDKQAPIQMMSDRFTRKVVPISFAMAALIFIVTKDWNRVLNMLVIDYVCGVKLSTATAISASIGKAARKGVLIKGGQTLETLAKVNTVIFDKTGTITEGRPIVTNIQTFNGYSEQEILGLAASAEEHSSHPIAEAITLEAKSRAIDIPEHDDETLENIIGKGISVLVQKEKVIVGSRSFMEDNEITIDTTETTGVYVAKEEQLIGIIEIEDQVRQGMNRCMNQMRRHGIDEVIMLTGDYKQSAKNIANRTSIDEYIAEAMPQEKASFVRFLKKEKDRTIMMVGDGINDAPALAYADIGVTLGAKKTDIAIETADVVIHSDNPLLLSDVVRLSQQTMNTIKQNVLATLIINTAAIALGTFGRIQPITGAAIHNAATIGVVLNSAKLIVTGGRMNVFQIQNHSLNTRKNKTNSPGISEHKRVFSY
ncbi:heavy metal translocating P-type ATPase [Bacillus weihaiensis]|uniref:Cd(2+)-exporting ATPase n=1 Tax=Bacillus weihaiensis TaxID=1547283 RepID=A0A1L3MR94_9BACI|nr:heavy metal translocating P-type ATPase [Bacillus weihaiensis]APH04863.1 cadmium-translocating P-type ATPase [Bacillus weihaiensis]